MHLCTLHVLLNARDLGFERFDARLQLLDRQGIQILFGELDQGVARLAREQVFEVHEPAAE